MDQRRRFRRTGDAFVAVVRHALDARQRAFGQERQHPREIQRRPIAQPQRQRAARRFRALSADGGRRHAATFAERGVEAAQAVEAGRERDLRHRQRCLRQQLFRQQHAPRGVHDDRRRAGARHEQAAQLPAAHADAFGEVFDRAVLQDAFRISPSARCTVSSPMRANASGDSSGRQRRQGR